MSLKSQIAFNDQMSLFEKVMSAIRLIVPDYSNSRHLQNVFSRIIACHYLDSKGLSVTEISTIMNKDHSTIHYYKNEYENLIKYDTLFQDFSKLVYKSLDN